MRKLSTLALALVALLVLSLGSVAVAATHGHADKQSKHHKQRKARKAVTPLSGIYDACAVSSPNDRDALPDCGDRLAVLRQGGFRVVLNYGTAGMSMEDNLAYAAEAQAHGMQVIWNIGTYLNLN